MYGEGLLKIQQKLLDIESEKLQVQKELFEIKKAELVIKQQKHQVNLIGVTFINPEFIIMINYIRPSCFFLFSLF